MVSKNQWHSSKWALGQHLSSLSRKRVRGGPLRECDGLTRRLVSLCWWEGGTAFSFCSLGRQGLTSPHLAEVSFLFISWSAGSFSLLYVTHIHQNVWLTREQYHTHTSVQNTGKSFIFLGTKCRLLMATFGSKMMGLKIAWRWSSLNIFNYELSLEKCISLPAKNHMMLLNNWFARHLLVSDCIWGPL